MLTKFAAIVLLAISLSGTAKAAFDTDVAESVKNLRRVNCLAKTTLGLQYAADEFSYYIQRGCNAASSLTIELNDATQLMSYTSNVVATNAGTCNNSRYTDSLDATKVPSSTCSSNLITQMGNLYTKFTETNGHITTGLTAIYASDPCVKKVMNDFQIFLNSFEKRIAVCASL